MALMDPNAEHFMREAGVPYSDAHDHDYEPTIVGLCRRPNCRRPQSAHIARIAQPPFMEPRLVRHTYGDAPKRDHAQHGQGQLTPEWKSWARITLTPIDSEYR